ncbi:MAG: site-2 protease family protein [Planctomycetes bacterium]|nr:site-2 protease family protein [Planctomycetota bacterium]
MSFDSLINMLLIVLGFGFLIGIHELGHFIAAKWAGIRTNAFAIGMGPQLFSYRKGIGVCYKSTSPKVIARFGKDASSMSDSELATNGLSETEYSLRILPIGGFVSMLGQEDGNPDAVSQDPRSYNMCTIGKRMIVVSAGVVMNMLLACFLFLVCFQVGVNFEAPVIGMIIPDSPAATVSAEGFENNPIQPGDTVVVVDGKPAKTFTDVQIAGAMAKPGSPVVLDVKREGVDSLLRYIVTPASISQEGLLELGLYPASSLRLRSGDSGKAVIQSLHAEPNLLVLQEGMQMLTADGKPVEVWSQFNDIVQAANGNQVETTWNIQGESLEVVVKAQPVLSVQMLVDVSPSAPQNYERGLLGLSPLTEIATVLPSSANAGLFNSGDIVLKAGSIEAPRMAQLRNYLAMQPDGDLPIIVKRDDRTIELTSHIQSGKLGVLLVDALTVPIIAQPMQQEMIGNETVDTPIAHLQLLGGSKILSINGTLVSNWTQIRKALVASGSAATIELVSPIQGNQKANIQVPISIKEQEELAGLLWSSPLAMQMFDPIYVTRSSGGNPLKALAMGFDETVDMLVMTYLTLDRLMRRSVGVEQLRGPIGIVHIGSKIADRGISYLFFFLAIISVNLAVLNFLPLPIVDGGLFLYLLYEKMFKKPPSIAFQNAAAVLGLGLIATLFLVTFYNDIARLVG